MKLFAHFEGGREMQTMNNIFQGHFNIITIYVNTHANTAAAAYQFKLLDSQITTERYLVVRLDFITVNTE